MSSRSIRPGLSGALTGPAKAAIGTSIAGGALGALGHAPDRLSHLFHRRFPAVAVTGMTVRRIESDHHFHKRLHDFTEAIEHALTALLLVALGAVLPLLLVDLTWASAGLALAHTRQVELTAAHVVHQNRGTAGSLLGVP